MINLAIVGLYNRGQQDEYVEMEAASSCSLSRFTLIRRVENDPHDRGTVIPQSAMTAYFKTQLQ